MFRRYLVAALLSSILLVALFRSGITYNFLRTVWWYDIPLHVVGGMALGFLSVWFLGNLNRRFVSFSRVSVPIASLTIVFLIGISWEIFEYHFGLLYNPVFSYPVDTAKDLLMDVLGAGVVVLLYSRHKNTATQEQT